MKTLFKDTLKIVNVGLAGFGDNVVAAGGECVTLTWQPPAQGDRDVVDGREGHDVGRRALQHRHVLGARLRQGRHQGHRRGAGPDHHHPLAAVVEVVGPVLRVDDGPGEAVEAGQVGEVALVVVVVAAAGPQEAAGHLLGLAAAVDGDRPTGGPHDG